MTNSRVIAVNDISRVTVNLDAMINVFTRTPRCVYIASCVINHTCNKLHRESKKETKLLPVTSPNDCELIFKTLSLTDSLVNLQ